MKRMKRIGWGLISVMLGIAVQVTKIEGEFFAWLAWIAVVLGIALVAAAAFPAKPIRDGKRKRTRKTSGSDLRRALRVIGNEVLDFARRREAEAPSGIHYTQPSVFHPARTVQEWRALRRYEQDTMSLYAIKHGPRVRAAIRESLDRYIGRNEAQALLKPRNLTEIRDVGQRLVEVGQPPSRRRKAA